MKYSNVILTDDNFDEELENLCEFAKVSICDYNSFVVSIEGFKLQENNQKEEWIKIHGSFPDKGSDFKQAYQRGQLAYEFGNGFIILDYEILI